MHEYAGASTRWATNRFFPSWPGIDALRTRADVLSELTRLHHEYAGSFFFASGTGQDAHRLLDSDRRVGEQAAWGLPDRDYYTKTDDKSVKIREQYAAYVQQLLGLAGECPEQARADSDATLRIETALAKASLTRVERRDPHNTYHMHDRSKSFLRLAPSIDWPQYFAGPGRAGRGQTQRFAAGVHQGGRGGIGAEDVAALRGYLRFHLL